jgi:hypothetical protein
MRAQWDPGEAEGGATEKPLVSASPVGPLQQHRGGRAHDVVGRIPQSAVNGAHTARMGGRDPSDGFEALWL